MPEIDCAQCVWECAVERWAQCVWWECGRSAMWRSACVECPVECDARSACASGAGERLAQCVSECVGRGIYAVRVRVCPESDGA